MGGIEGGAVILSSRCTMSMETVPKWARGKNASIVGEQNTPGHVLPRSPKPLAWKKQEMELSMYTDQWFSP